ncbi:MAG TPA: cytochrome d ubiquinol oxidase subunit II [Woeseiaceae bacterium]|nr:cytochrome d ubiquinol oxidase subunit II [Woeseiaceae bacterium]
MPETLPDLATPAGWLPMVFMLIMGIAILAYVLLDGYDLGVGMLLLLADDADKNRMIASIGPFWDANETWLVLGIGILLVAFPVAHGVILGALYLPVALMLLGLILRGVAFDFRVKAKDEHRTAWDRSFFAGSLIAALAQGYMLGRVVTGFAADTWSFAFAILIGFCLASGYVVLGATWLVIKTTAALQRHAIDWARRAIVLLAIGIAAVSVATPLVSRQVFEKWFALEQLMVLWPIPAMTAGMFFIAYRSLGRLPVRLDADNPYGDWVPFAATVVIFMLAFHGLAYSLYPWLVLDRMTIWDAAAAPESLTVILVGTAFVLPVIIGYSAYAYRVFGGKAVDLEYY